MSKPVLKLVLASESEARLAVASGSAPVKRANAMHF